MAGVDSSGRNELGLFPVCYVVQSRAELCVLRLSAAVASVVVSAEHCWLRRPGRRLRRAAAVRHSRSNGSDYARLARPRTFVTAVAVFLTLSLIASYGGLFGYQTEAATRASILMGLVVALCALIILMVRRRTQTPEDHQRVRWVIWGCLIGLPAFTIAELASQTTFFMHTPWGDLTPPEHVIGLLYLVNGILCLFVFEAVRRTRVVNVSIPLRRVTILGLTLSVPVLLLHGEVERIHEHLELPKWAWLGIGAVILFLISRLHEIAVELADRCFNRTLDRAEAELSHAILRARTPADVDVLLTDEPFRVLKLASAAAFRLALSSGGLRAEMVGTTAATRTLPPDEPMIAPLSKGAPFSLAEGDEDNTRLPSGLRRPILARSSRQPNPLLCRHSLWAACVRC